MLAILALIIIIGWLSPADAGEGTWPKTLQTPKGTLTLYQPQPESFDADAATIEARAALSFIKTGETAPQFGAILFTAKYEVDRDARTALLKGIKIKDWKFPSATQEQADKLQGLINSTISEKSVETSLDELIHALKGADIKTTSPEKLDNTPPRILYRETPAALVVIDGKPLAKEIEGTDFKRIINTPYMMIYDTKDKTYYLNGNNSWFTTKNVLKEWKQASSIPAGLQETAESQGLAELESADGDSSTIPEIIVSEVPAELISMDGPPDYSQIDGAGLLYVNNSGSILILDISEQEYYTLISGRWYKSKSLADDSKWEYVSTDNIPAEFDNIPTSEKTETIKAAIPGTPEANEAVLDASIPQTAEVRRDSPSPEITYDGKPEFEKTGSSGVNYAVNTPSSVIKVGNTYYLCEEAIWYKSNSATGPWEVCTEVPGEIYEIPPESPVYNTTYVRVYDYTPEVVYCGYTPGYYGSYIYGGTVVYGTGYYYRPWRGAFYYPRPYTWGFAVRYNPWAGSWGFGIGYRPNRGGGFYFGIGFGGGWSGGGWWGRGGYYDRNRTTNINIDNSINIGRGNIGNGNFTKDGVRDRKRNAYNNKDGVKSLQDRRDNLRPEQRDARKDRAKDKRDNLSPEQKDARKDRAKDKRDNLSPEQKDARKDKAKDKRDNITPEQRDARKDKDKDRKDNLSPEQRDARKDSVQNRREEGKGATKDRVNNAQQQPTRDRVSTQQDLSRQTAKPSNTTNWQQSKRDNNVYSDKSGNVYRSNKATNDWQKVGNDGKWSNSKPSQSTRQNLSRTQSNRQSGATRQRQTQQRQTQSRQRQPSSASRNRSSGGGNRSSGGSRSGGSRSGGGRRR